MANKIRVVSDGTAMGTRIFACNRENGADIELTGVDGIEFYPLKPGGVLGVRLSFIQAEIDVLADLKE